jgi:Bacterial Ig-like domain (group 2)
MSNQDLIIYLAGALLAMDVLNTFKGMLGGVWSFLRALFTPSTSKNVRVEITLPGSVPVTLSYNAEGIVMASFQCPDDQQFVLPVTFRDSKGQPATAFNLKWTSSDPTVMTVTDNGNGTCTVAGVKPGNAQVQLTASGKADGSDPITVTPFEVQVIGGEAVSADFQPGPLQPQTPAPVNPPAPA